MLRCLPMLGEPAHTCDKAEAHVSLMPWDVREDNGTMAQWDNNELSVRQR